MTRLPNLTPNKVIKALERAGFVRVNQRGSHVYLRHHEQDITTTVPVHPGDLHRGLLKKIIKQVGLTEDQFRALL